MRRGLGTFGHLAQLVVSLLGVLARALGAAGIGVLGGLQVLGQLLVMDRHVGVRAVAVVF